ncbi:MAG: D-glycero-alpha-D-manno-heptose 1-phosphate guanylyltransferase [Turneriella sp.]|nr:D-glycero-alpha-D-manno-heptose 1-phosphate guanylyltransferase [Turneriella sp.]
MNGFLLAAGLGTRLKPLTDKIAKPALPIAGLPMLVYPLNFFFEAKVKKLAVNTHHAPETIRAVLEKIEQPWELYISHEKKLLDTGGGLKACEAFLKEERVLLANADIVAGIDIERLLRFHEARLADLTLVVVPHKDADKIAPITLGEKDAIVDINRTLDKKSTGKHLYAGVAVFEPLLWKYLHKEPSSIVYTAYVSLIASGARVCAYTHEGTWFDCGTPENYHAASNAVASDAWYWQKILHPHIRTAFG